MSCFFRQHDNVRLPMYSPMNLLSFAFSLFALPSIAFATPIVEGDTITWPDDGWYQVQRTHTYETVCNGGNSCTVEPGSYTVINHDTDIKYRNIIVGSQTSNNTGPSVEGNTIRWTDEGWHEVQRLPDHYSICEGGQHCVVEPGDYRVINHSTGVRWPTITVSENAMPPTSNTLVLNLVGTGAMYEDLVPAADGLGAMVTAWCFDVDLIDMKSGRDVGSATDCLDPSLGADKLSASGLAMIGTSYFNFPDGMLAIQGRTSVQPINWPTREFTHITGGNSAANAVLYGTGKYLGTSGTARLSGMVDLSNFDMTPGSFITFDCLFVIELDN